MATTEQAKPRPEKTIDGWFRELNGGRMEVMVRSADCRLRVTGTPEQVWEAIELWEQWTGLTVNAEKRPRRVAAPIAGQLTMAELMGEPESEGNDGSE